MKWVEEPAPGEPKLACFGLAFAQARNCGTVFTSAGTAGPTPKPNSKLAITDTGVRSVKGS